MATNYVTDVNAIKKVMIDRNITSISMLSELSGVNRDTLGRILSEKEQPTATTMYKLVDTLQLTATQAGNIFFRKNLHTA